MFKIIKSNVYKNFLTWLEFIIQALRGKLVNEVFQKRITTLKHAQINNRKWLVNKQYCIKQMESYKDKFAERKL